MDANVCTIVLVVSKWWSERTPCMERMRRRLYIYGYDPSSIHFDVWSNCHQVLLVNIAILNFRS